MAKKMKWNQILHVATIRYQQIITACNKADCTEMEGLCLSSLFSSEDELYEGYDDIRFSNDDGLMFTVNGHKFWCEVCVGYGLSSKDKVINTAERWKNGEQFGEFSDKYVIWGSKTGVDEDLNLTPVFINWYYGAADDLKPGAIVPQHIIGACKEWLKDN